MTAYLVSGRFSDYYGLVALAAVVIYAVVMNHWFDRKEAKRAKHRRRD